MQSHEIEYKIYGDDMQLVNIILDPEESVIAEAGAMMTMTNAIHMDTILGDGTNQNQGILNKMVGAGKRLLTGESLFMTVFSNIGQKKESVSFAAPFPGKILPIDLTKYNNKIICQKDSFLCAAKGVSVNIAFNKKLGAGFFGGEGFIMQSLEGDGLAFIHAGGALIKKELGPGETIKVDTGCLVAMTSTVDYDIQMVGGIKTAMFGGEGLFLATLRGSGTVWMQSLPFSRLADKIISSSSYSNNQSKQGEGGLVSGLIGDVISGNLDY